MSRMTFLKAALSAADEALSIALRLVPVIELLRLETVGEGELITVDEIIISFLLGNGLRPAIIVKDVTPSEK